jgi:hypothetical protein
MLHAWYHPFHHVRGDPYLSSLHLFTALSNFSPLPSPACPHLPSLLFPSALPLIIISEGQLSPSPPFLRHLASPPSIELCQPSAHPLVAPPTASIPTLPSITVLIAPSSLPRLLPLYHLPATHAFYLHTRRSYRLAFFCCLLGLRLSGAQKRPLTAV